MERAIDNITRAFSKDSPAFMPYFTLGYPDYQTSLEIVQACAEAGADLMELGIPFSDPLADGPTIQHSTQVALENGMTVSRCLDAIRELRRRGVAIPLILMGYYNPILSYGLLPFVREAAESNVNGFIIPDLPPEEAEEMLNLCEEHGLALIFLITPNSTDERLKQVCKKSTGFTYLVSVTGITGARDSLPSNLTDSLQRARKYTRTPLAVGFGISTPEQAQAVGKLADGVIVGSALIKAVQKSVKNGGNPVETAGSFARQVHASLHVSVQP